jgi:phosphate acetyltransferase
MSWIIETLKAQAKKSPRKIVFPDFKDERVKQAAEIIKQEGIAVPVLLSPSNMDQEHQEEFASFYHNLRPNKSQFEEARELMEDPLYYGAMFTRLGYADGIVAGSSYPTSAVAKAALRCLEVDDKYHLVSSCFIMSVPDCSYGQRGVFIYADCGIIPYPSVEQLSSIAISSAEFAKNILGYQPRVAFLSFSTKGSAKGRWIDKVREATELTRSKEPELLVDGELQADAALDEQVAKRKLPQSYVAGKANVLIFPNLDAGNICYKLTQRLAKARALGPIILGLKQTCSDLSRGCTVEDIVDSAAVAVVRSQYLSPSKE